MSSLPLLPWEKRAFAFLFPEAWVFDSSPSSLKAWLHIREWSGEVDGHLFCLDGSLTPVPLFSCFSPTLSLAHNHTTVTCKTAWILLVSGVPSYSELSH